MQDAIQLEFDKIEGDVRVHCDNRNWFIVTADEKLTAFLEEVHSGEIKLDSLTRFE